MRPWLLPATTAAWALAALVGLLAAVAVPGAAGLFAFLGAAACAALAWLAWRGKAGDTWGAAPLAVLVAAPVLYALWWGAPPMLVLVLPPAALLALEPRRRAPALPREGRGALLVVLLAYLALAPPLDGMLLAPGEPAPMATSADVFVGGTTPARALPGGRLWEQRATAEGLPSVGLVRVQFPPGADLGAPLRAAFLPGAEQSFFPIPFPVFITEERGHRVEQLPGEWFRVVLQHETTTLFWFLPIPMEDVEVHQFLLKPVERRWRLSMLPPFASEEVLHAGFHLDQAGNNSAMLQRLDGRTQASGRVLALPQAAYEDTAAGRLQRDTPGPEMALALLAAAAAALARRKAKL